MASSSTLLTKRTIGASSTSSRPTRRRTSSSPPETSSDSRSTPSSSPRLGIAVSTCSMALSSIFCSLSSSTTMASTPSPHWNLISSMACRLVGSATPMNRRLPRLNSGITRCLASNLSETARTASRSTVSGIQIEQRHAVLGGGRNRDVARLGRPLQDQLGDEAGFPLGGRLQCSMHAGFVDDAVLYQPLR